MVCTPGIPLASFIAAIRQVTSPIGIALPGDIIDGQGKSAAWTGSSAPRINTIEVTAWRLTSK
jgi:hypothetical protein